MAEKSLSTVNTDTLRTRWLRTLGGAVCVALLTLFIVWHQGWLLRLKIDTHTVTLPADGRMHFALDLSWNDAGLRGFGQKNWDRITVTGGNGVEVLPERQIGQKNSADFASVILTSPVMPGEMTLRIRQPGLSKRLHPLVSIVRVKFVTSDADSFGDGMPDFLRLHSSEDRKAFRAWFTLIAEQLYDRNPATLPAGVEDCAGLLRYAYREALMDHDDRWFADQKAAGLLTVMPPLESVHQYQYPETPLGASLFRTRVGVFSADDLADGAFAQFADAHTLMDANTHFISRDIHMALSGDLIFYRQLGQRSPYHSMIVTSGGTSAVVYHTGPIGKAKGEMRRMTILQLLNYPDARWRPVPSNPNFLGVYRWNILREDD
jgi:uncharacterized protein YfaT (DUF1175 family)